MKTQKLKELAQQATLGPWKWFTSNSHNRLSSVPNGKDGDVISAFKAADGVRCVSVSREDMGFIEAAHPGAVLELIERLEAAEKLAEFRSNSINSIDKLVADRDKRIAELEAAERERDVLKRNQELNLKIKLAMHNRFTNAEAEIARLDKESQRLSDQLGACDRQRLDWLKRALTSEAEIARRDAAAGEPVAVISDDSLAQLKESYRPVLVFRPDHKRESQGVELYTAAPPAVLPGEVEELSVLIRRLVHSLKNSNPHSGLLISVPDYMRRKGIWKSTDFLRGDDVKQG